MLDQPLQGADVARLGLQNAATERDARVLSTEREVDPAEASKHGRRVGIVRQGFLEGFDGVVELPTFLQGPGRGVVAERFETFLLLNGPGMGWYERPGWILTRNCKIGRRKTRTRRRGSRFWGRLLGSDQGRRERQPSEDQRDP